MRKKMIFLLVSFTIIFISAELPAGEEKTSLTTYYPAPYGAYRQMMVGSGVKQPKPENMTTLIRTGVTDDSYDLKEATYAPALLEIGGIAEVPKDVTNPPTSFGLYSEGDVGICGVSATNGQPAIIGYKPPLSDGTLCEAPAIMGTGSKVGVKGEGDSTGVEGSGTEKGIYGFSNCSHGGGIETLHYGVYGEATNSVTPSSSAKLYGVYGKADNLTDTAAIGYGVYGIGDDYGGYFVGPTAGKFEGNVDISGNLDISGRADPATLNIPVVTENPSSAQEGDLIYNKSGTGRLLLFVDGAWKSI